MHDDGGGGGGGGQDILSFLSLLHKAVPLAVDPLALTALRLMMVVPMCVYLCWLKSESVNMWIRRRNVCAFFLCVCEWVSGGWMDGGQQQKAVATPQTTHFPPLRDK